MTLAFLNPSRSYDQQRRRVRFVGHDGMLEIDMAIEADALGVTLADSSDAARCLAAFDAKRDTIQAVAHKVYSKRRQTVCVLTLADFR